ncbi:MAG: hypothetical protein ACREK9_04315, partial [Candidatus Rokuibacteriota bacterium]
SRPSIGNGPGTLRLRPGMARMESTPAAGSRRDGRGRADPGLQDLNWGLGAHFGHRDQLDRRIVITSIGGS